MRRGQTEMIGLVFVVVIIVIGIVLFLRFSATDSSGETASQVQGATSFLVALTETTIPSCGTSFQRAAASCVEGRSFCNSGDPCEEIQKAMRAIAGAALESRGIKYNLSLENTEVMMYTDDCMTGDPAVDIVAQPFVPIVLGGGRGSKKLSLAICP